MKRKLIKLFTIILIVAATAFITHLLTIRTLEIYVNGNDIYISSFGQTDTFRIAP